MNARTISARALSRLTDRAMRHARRAAGVSAGGKLRHFGRTAIAAGAGLAIMLAAGVAAQARISLSARPGLTFVEAENVAQLRARFDEAEAEGRRLMVYFAADWCATCAGIERFVFPDPDAIEALAPLRLIKVDVTKLDEGRAALLKELQVAGPPTMVFFGAGRQEADGTRLVGAIEARDLVASAMKAGAQ